MIPEILIVKKRERKAYEAALETHLAGGPESIPPFLYEVASAFHFPSVDSRTLHAGKPSVSVELEFAQHATIKENDVDTVLIYFDRASWAALKAYVDEAFNKQA